MKLFSRNYSKAGPGVSRDTPRKKGFARLIEILGRDFGTLLKLNLTFILCALPAIVFGALAILYFDIEQPLLMLIAAGISALFGIVVGPAFTALHYIIVKMLRDDPGFFWHNFWASFKMNFKVSALPGVLFTLIVNSQNLFFYTLIRGESGGVLSLVILLISMLFFAMIYPYLFIQLAHVDLKAGPALKNALLLSLGNLPRSFLGVLVGPLLISVQLLFLDAIPIVSLLLLFVGISFPSLFNLMCTFPPVDKIFEIEKTLAARRRAEAEAAVGELMNRED